MKQPLSWQIATVTGIHPETPSVKTITLTLPGWFPHRPGQHYDLRLTAPDGYQAQRSYSIASEPEHIGEIDLTIERLEDGEVSTYLHDVLQVSDQIEVRGPIGGYFVWKKDLGGPLLLIAGGSGVVPLMAMIRHRFQAKSSVLTRLLYSSRSPQDVIYADELDRLQAADDGFKVIHTFTRSQPASWRGYARRIDAQILREVLASIPSVPLTYVCGPTRLVESVADGLVQIGIPPERIRTERFGPTGGTP